LLTETAGAFGVHEIPKTVKGFFKFDGSDFVILC